MDVRFAPSVDAPALVGSRVAVSDLDGDVYTGVVLAATADPGEAPAILLDDRRCDVSHQDPFWMLLEDGVGVEVLIAADIDPAVCRVIDRPVPASHAGWTVDEIHVNFLSHQFAAWDGSISCTNCDARASDAAASYPCGELPARITYR